MDIAICAHAFLHCFSVYCVAAPVLACVPEGVV